MFSTNPGILSSGKWNQDFCNEGASVGVRRGRQAQNIKYTFNSANLIVIWFLMVHQGEVQEYGACWFSEEADKRANLVMNISDYSQLQTLKQRTTGCEFLSVSLCTQQKASFHIYLFFYQVTSNQSLRRGCTAPTVGAGARKPKIKPPFRLLQSLQVPPSSHSTHIQLTDEKHSQQAASECEKVCEGSFAEHL